MSETDTWECDAYGPGGRDVGAWCFFAEPDKRACASQGECRERMDAERRRVFARIQEMAAQGDPTGEFLAGEFTSPEQLLGGGAGTVKGGSGEGDEDHG